MEIKMIIVIEKTITQVDTSQLPNMWDNVGAMCYRGELPLPEHLLLLWMSFYITITSEI